MSKKFYLIVVSLVALLGIGVGAMVLLTMLKPDKPKAKIPEATRYVRAAEVVYSDLNTSVIATGRLSSIDEVSLSSEVQGVLQAGVVSVSKGESFKRGDLLVEIINDELVYSLKAQKSRFMNTLANVLPDLELDFPDAYALWNTFFEELDVTEPLDDLPPIENTQLKTFLAARNILADYYSIKSTEARMAKHKIYAPFTGSYTSENLQSGSVVNPGAVIARIINTDSYEIEASVEKDEVGYLKTGAKVTVIPDRAGAENIEGKILRISNFVDPQTQTVPVFVSVKNSKSPVYAGDYYRCVFDNIVVKNVFEILRSAVFNHNEVFVIKDNRLIKKTVDVQKVNQKSLFFNGIGEGALVVNEALINATENEKVEVLPEN
ncbi:MAG: HlyD family efflux transporter periplasmic adaptor subunit [Salinivirgaceae bacterium]|jgi:membrane fusion protein (multidrug efflux system)|nr:HlyD family efflux transporter periplasmic adaptor subunit [Salinivirgaceae bacterium]